MTRTLEGTLAHYGVKGMHWGQAKSEPTSTGSSAAKPHSLDPARAAVVQRRKEIGYITAKTTLLAAAGLTVTMLTGTAALGSASSASLSLAIRAAEESRRVGKETSEKVMDQNF